MMLSSRQFLRRAATYTHTHTWSRSLSNSHTSSTGSSPLVLLEVKDQVATITLNNGIKLNPMTVELGEAFQSVAEEVAADTTRDIRSVVLTGAGKAFSAGGDLAWLEARTKEEPSKNVEIMRHFYSMFLSIRKVPVPVISAINGPAIGAGLCLAMATDLRIAAKEAKLGFTFASLGLHPGMAGTFFLPRLVPFQTATELLLTGKIINGQEAARLGLVTESVEQANLLPRAHELAKAIAQNSPVAVRGTLATLRQMQEEQGLARGLQREAEAQAICYTSDDYKKGLEGVRTKTKPVFAPFV